MRSARHRQRAIAGRGLVCPWRSHPSHLMMTQGSFKRFEIVGVLSYSDRSARTVLE